jgi:hypothetical protein
MRITKEEVVAGHSALRVRGFLRRFERGFFMLSGFSVRGRNISRSDPSCAIAPKR